MILKQLILVSHPDEEGNYTPSYVGYMLAVGMFAGTLVGALGECQYFQNMMRVGMQARSALVQAIFRKATRLSPEGRTGNNVGKISNLISTDAEAVQAFVGQCGKHAVMRTPVRPAEMCSWTLMAGVVHWPQFHAPPPPWRR